MKGMRLLLLVPLCLAAEQEQAGAQANVTFRSGAVGLDAGHGALDFGTNVGIIAKFNVTPLFRLRTELDIDRSAMKDVSMGSYHGDQTAAFSSFGVGTEVELGNKDYAIFANLTPHMTLRTTTRVLKPVMAEQELAENSRFSLGASAGLGAEMFITNNIGLELQAQYVVFNFDHDDADPRYTGIRIDAGVQFYLGQNFER